jgi:hypothetical protein
MHHLVNYTFHHMCIHILDPHVRFDGILVLRRLPPPNSGMCAPAGLPPRFLRARFHQCATSRCTAMPRRTAKKAGRTAMMRVHGRELAARKSLCRATYASRTAKISLPSEVCRAASHGEDFAVHMGLFTGHGNELFSRSECFRRQPSIYHDELKMRDENYINVRGDYTTAEKS